MAAGEQTWIRYEPSVRGLHAATLGEWTIRHVDGILGALEDLPVDGAKAMEIDASGLKVIDTTGALLLHEFMDSLKAQGISVTLVGVPPAFGDLLTRVAESNRRQLDLDERPRPILAGLERLGRGSVEAFVEGRDLVSFLGQTTLVALRIVLNPSRLRLVSTISHMQSAGLNALPIVGLLSFLIGIVLAYQSADQLARFGAQLFTVNLLGISVLREIGVVLTAIVVAGRSGSAFTAQIGTMKVREEVDAMRTLGMDPIEVLVIPRILALVIVLPLLVFYADVMALLGGALMSLIVLDISMLQFSQQLERAVTASSFWLGIGKAPTFAFLIALVGCFQGLRVEGSAESVGRLTTQAVVESIFLVIVADAIYSVVASLLGI